MRRERILIKRLLCILIGLATVLSLASCKEEAEGAQEDEAAVAVVQKKENLKSIGFYFPNEYEARWTNIVEATTQKLQEWSEGGGVSYTLEVGYANDDASQQAKMVMDAAEQGINGIVIVPVDSYSRELAKAVDYAKLKGASIVAYDRLIMNTEAIDTYVTYDPYLSGRMAAESFLEKLNARTQGVPRIEILVNDAGDGSSRYFYSGAMDLLKPMIDQGQIVVASGKTSYEQTCVSDMQVRTAETAFNEILNQYYTGNTSLDGVLTQDDSIALGVIKALESKGYAAGQFPIVTGAGCYQENVKKITAGRQALSLFRDERVMGPLLAAAIDNLVNNKILSGLDRTIYNNGAMIVPALLETPVLVDASNYKEILLGSEYYNYTHVAP